MDLSKTTASDFSPLDPLHRRKLWVRFQTPATTFYHIYWRRLALTLGILALLGWLAAAAAAWTYIRTSRDFSGASYLNIALPWRWSEHRASLGRHYLARARIELEQQDYAAAYQHLTAGLARVPNDTAGRRLLAFVQIRFGRPDLALHTLSAGAQLAGADLDYLKLLFGLLLEAQQDDRVITLATSLLPTQPDAVLAHQFTALQAATAHFHRGRYDATEQLISAWGLDRSLEGSILLARCDWERGYPDLALLRLENNLPRFPRRDELYIALIRYYRELGRTDAARQTALLRRFNDPVSPGPRIDVLHTAPATSETAATSREVDTYLADFAADPQALVLLAWFGSDTAQPALVQRTLALARSRKYLPNAFNLALAQSQIAATDYRAALTTTETALREDNEDNRFFTATLDGLRALALFGLRDTGRAEL
ncbi:MAG: tetratricopeptide repeat protein, partial [Undibacterium sp.]|nr:tetratricopeptide repeat protein [Opitutaceae bacterium]